MHSSVAGDRENKRMLTGTGDNADGSTSASFIFAEDGILDTLGMCGNLFPKLALL
jgi:hypothetical protein